MMHGKPKYQGHVMCHFGLEQMMGRAMLMGLMTRKGAYWSFKALGLPATGHTIQLVVRVRSDFCGTGFSRVTVTVVEGKQLAARDSGGFMGKASSDPYYVLKFKKRELKSDYVKKSLNPRWNSPPFELGLITEGEAKALKISVFDYDIVSEDDFMGSVWIPGSALYNAGPGTHNLWFVLGPRKKSEGHMNITGEVLLSFTVVDME